MSQFEAASEKKYNSNETFLGDKLEKQEFDENAVIESKELSSSKEQQPKAPIKHQPGIVNILHPNSIWRDRINTAFFITFFFIAEERFFYLMVFMLVPTMMEQFLCTWRLQTRNPLISNTLTFVLIAGIVVKLVLVSFRTVRLILTIPWCEFYEKNQDVSNTLRKLVVDY